MLEARGAYKHVSTLTSGLGVPFPPFPDQGNSVSGGSVCIFLLLIKKAMSLWIRQVQF